VRIALLVPTYWPEVRRGSERLVHDLAVALVDRGHEVAILTSHRARPARAVEDRVEVSRAWRPPELPPLSWYEHHVSNLPGIVWRLLRGGYDLAHASFTADAWAATRARALGGPPVVFSFHGIPTREFLVGRRYRLEMMAAAVGRSEAVSVLSGPAAEPFRRYFGREPSILPGGVRCADFAVDGRRPDAPTLVCAASLGDPRKGARLLFDAFVRLRRSHPGARLLLVRTADPVMSEPVRTIPAGAEWIDGDDTADLARAFASASVSVLAAVHEAFGLVLLESLAAGTPVVAARSGALAEIVTSDAVGRLFSPGDVESCVRAMEEAIELGSRPETGPTCRDRAAEYDWSRIVERYERLYEQALG
jgi:glycosyltransferase involved in cell wall biosynthesis